MAHKPLHEVKRRPVSTLASLRDSNTFASQQAGQALVGEAKSFGLDLRAFLDLAIDTRMAEDGVATYADLSGYEAALAVLQLPVGDNFRAGHVLDLASDTFQTYPGTRAMFPEVIDDVLQWKYRQNIFESTSSFVSQSRTINGIEMVTTVVDDAQADYQNFVPVAEFGRTPTKTIRTGEQAIKFYKHGGGLRISYEFERRARLDILTPYQARAAVELERAKVAHATAVMVNGDGLNPASTIRTQSSLKAGATANTLDWEALLAWFVLRAKAGVPVDTVMGNWDAYLLWLKMFGIPTSDLNRTSADNLRATGFSVNATPILSGNINFVLSTTMPAGQLLGFSRADTIEELIEAGSNIQESERAMVNQSITYTKTINSGYKLIFPDTRDIFNYAA